MLVIDFLLKFCALTILIEFGWILISIAIFETSALIKRRNSLKIGMFLDKLLYAFFLCSTIIIAISNFRIINDSPIFWGFMIFVGLVWLTFFFSDKKKTIDQQFKGEKPTAIKTIDEGFFRFTQIEKYAILLFIPISFFPELIKNPVTENVYAFLNYIASIKYLGALIGLFGFMSLGRYFILFINFCSSKIKS